METTEFPKVEPELLSCGHLSTPRGFAAGYATRVKDGAKICYDCADRMQREELLVEKEVFGYLSSDGKLITTWTGGELMKVTSEGSARTGFYGSRVTYVRAEGPDGSRWYGKNGGRGMSIRMKRAKEAQ